MKVNVQSHERTDNARSAAHGASPEGMLRIDEVYISLRGRCLTILLRPPGTYQVAEPSAGSHLPLDLRHCFKDLVTETYRGKSGEGG